MTNDVLGKVLGIILILIAVWLFDWYEWTQLGVSTVLFLSGLNSLLQDAESEAVRKFAKASIRIAAAISVFLIIKLLLERF
jgi:hypothetical protein